MIKRKLELVQTPPQAQRSVNIFPDDWARFKAAADAQGIPAAELLGRIAVAYLGDPVKPAPVKPVDVRQTFVASIQGKTNYQIANVILDVLEACKVRAELVYRLEGKRDLQPGKMTTMPIFGRMPNEFVPK